MSKTKFSFTKRIKSFKYAFSGLSKLFKEEHNTWIHMCAAVFAIVGGFYFSINSYEWIAIIFAIGIVLSMEAINTAIENLCDDITVEKRPGIKKVKDLAAAGVLISALSALVIGLLVFIPKILTLCANY